jgi:short-subunit dehydrogenase involved in D-alanine esterification of teichoic acids
MYVIRGLSTVVNDIRIAMTPINVEWAAKYGLGSWAVITGCTEGIGKAFSFTLAEIRFNLCLISRNKAKLETLQAELKAKYPMIETRIIVADFSSYSTEFYDRIVG